MTRLRLAATLVSVVILLAALDVFVRGPFFRDAIESHYVAPFKMLRDRTGGHAWSILFRALARAHRPKVRVAIVGDSTVYGTERLDDPASIAFLLREALRRRFPGRDVDVVDCSQIGLYASDAALMVNTALHHDVDVLVYGLTLRALPRLEAERSSSHIRSETSLAGLAALGVVGGVPWLTRTLSAAQLTQGIAYSTWATYAYRGHIKLDLWERWVAPALANAGQTELRKALTPGSIYPPFEITPRPNLSAAYNWTWQEYGFPNENWRALEILARVCERRAPGRCLLYAGPLNPLGRERQAEPGLYEDYLSRVRVLVGRHDLLWRDFTDTMRPEEFRKPSSGATSDPIHLNLAGGQRLVSGLADSLGPTVATLLGSRRTTAQVSGAEE